MILAGSSFMFSNCSSKRVIRPSDEPYDREAIDRTKGDEDEIRRRRTSSRRRSSRRSSGDDFSCSDCTNADQSQCDRDNERCVQCTANSHCSAGLVCNIANGTCLECRADSDCASRTDGRRTCNTNTNLCIECDGDANCDDNEVCHNNACVPCSRKCSSNQVCNESKVCVDLPSCGSQNQCPRTAPICVSNECKQCEDDDDCARNAAQDRPACNDDNMCARCTADSHCANRPEGNYCVEGGGQCVQCTEDAHCSNGVCNDQNRCVRCSSSDNSGCESGETCLNNNACVECQNDRDCSGSEDKCKTSTNTCVECLSQNDCGSDEVCRAGVCEDPGCSCENPCDDQTQSQIGPLAGCELSSRTGSCEVVDDDCFGNRQHLVDNCDRARGHWILDTGNFCSSGYEKIKILSNNNVEWHGGYFRAGSSARGTWRGGVFKQGEMRNTDWLNGTAEHGTFYNVNFQAGTAQSTDIGDSGDVMSRYTRAIKFCGGTFNGTWQGGFFQNGRFNGTWQNGSWNYGEWGSSAAWREGRHGWAGCGSRCPGRAARQSSAPANSRCFGSCDSDSNCYD